MDNEATQLIEADHQRSLDQITRNNMPHIFRTAVIGVIGLLAFLAVLAHVTTTYAIEQEKVQFIEHLSRN